MIYGARWLIEAQPPMAHHYGFVKPIMVREMERVGFRAHAIRSGGYNLIGIGEGRLKLAICPTMTRPHDAHVASLEAVVPALDAAGNRAWRGLRGRVPLHQRRPRVTMTRKALDWGADTIVYLDHDVGFRPHRIWSRWRRPRAMSSAAPTATRSRRSATWGR